MGVNAQRIDATGFFVSTREGLSITLTKAQIQAFFQTTSGNAATRRQLTIDWARGQIATALGLPLVQVELDIDAAQNPTALRTRNDVG